MVEKVKKPRRVSLDDAVEMQVHQSPPKNRQTERAETPEEMEAILIRKRERMEATMELESDLLQKFEKRRHKLNRELRVSIPANSKKRLATKITPIIAEEWINEFLDDCERLNAIPSLRSFEKWIPANKKGETWSRKTMSKYIAFFEAENAKPDGEGDLDCDKYAVGAMLNSLKLIAQDDIIIGGLTKTYDPGMAKFLANVDYEMTETVAVQEDSGFNLTIINDLGGAEEIEMAVAPEVE